MPPQVLLPFPGIPTLRKLEMGAAGEGIVDEGNAGCDSGVEGDGDKGGKHVMAEVTSAPMSLTIDIPNSPISDVVAMSARSIGS